MSCALKSVGGGGKQKRKASLVFSVGRVCSVLHDASGEFLSEEAGLRFCFSSLVMSVSKNLKGTREQCVGRHQNLAEDFEVQLRSSSLQRACLGSSWAWAAGSEEL